MSDIGRYEHQIGLLTDAIYRIGVEAGVLRDDLGGVSGAEALHFTKDILATIQHLKATQLRTIVPGPNDCHSCGLLLNADRDCWWCDQ